MKWSTFLALVLLLGIGGWYLYRSPEGPRLVGNALRAAFKDRPDPKFALDAMAKNFPRSVRLGEPVTEVATYIEKTDAPVFPLNGYLTFVGRSRYEYVFNWQGDHWVFLRLMSRENNQDITAYEGVEIMSGEEMARFLAPYKDTPLPWPIVGPVATPPPPPLPPPPVAARRTPTPQERALEVARKYGGSK